MLCVASTDSYMITCHCYYGYYCCCCFCRLARGQLRLVGNPQKKNLGKSFPRKETEKKINQYVSLDLT